MSAPRSFVASGHRSREDAQVALDALHDLAAADALKLADVAIVVKTDVGRVELHQQHELSTGEGAVGGGVVGILAGVLLGFPMAIPVAGAAVGAGLGLIDTGIDDGRLRRLGRELEPGHAALCALIGEADWAALRKRMAPLVDELLVVELTPEAEAAVRTVQEGGQA